jgi:hypothetical protein
VDLLCPRGPVLVGRTDGRTASPVEASRILPARAADAAGAVGEADMRYPAAHYLGIARQFGPRPDPRSREQQANLLCDDDAELLVILGIEVDAVGVA